MLVHSTLATINAINGSHVFYVHHNSNWRSPFQPHWIEKQQGNFNRIGEEININLWPTATKTQFFTILTLNTGYCTSCENSRKTVAKGSSHYIVKLHPIENLLGSFYFAWTKTLLSSLPLRRGARDLHISLSLSPETRANDILSVTL
jgi:hypothetical protein